MQKALLILVEIALKEFGDIVSRVQPVGRRAETTLKFRLSLRDETFVDIWLSPERGRYSFERS